MKTITKRFFFSLLFLTAANAHAEFIGCWDTTQLGIVREGKTWIINRGPEDSLWLSTSKKTTTAILNFAALSPVKGWTICLEGEMQKSEIAVSEALICTSDETVGICDPKSIIADSRLF